MSKKEFIKKWEKERDLWRRVVDEHLFYTEEERKKASSKLTAICAMLEDARKLHEFGC